MQSKYIKQTNCRVPASKSRFISWLNATIVVCLAFSLIYYVAGVNDLTVKGFDLKELKAEARALAVENENYQSQAMAKESLYSLKNQITELNLVAVEDITYISIPKTTVAKK